MMNRVVEMLMVERSLQRRYLQWQVVLEGVGAADCVAQPRATHHDAAAVLRRIAHADGVLREGRQRQACSHEDKVSIRPRPDAAAVLRCMPHTDRMLRERWQRQACTVHARLLPRFGGGHRRRAGQTADSTLRERSSAGRGRHGDTEMAQWTVGHPHLGNRQLV